MRWSLDLRARAVCGAVFVLAVLTSSSAWGQARDEEEGRRVRAAFNPVGKWKITRMDVAVVAVSETNPQSQGVGSGGAALGSITLDVGSSLGGDSFFEVRPDGSVRGEGTARYRFKAAYGSPIAAALGCVVGGQAELAGEPARKFTITGTADLERGTIILDPFRAGGGDLEVIVTPGERTVTLRAWPPMTKVDTDVLVQDATLLYQAHGKLPWARLGDKMHYIECSFEAVKHVDLAPLLERASAGSPELRGDKGAKSDRRRSRFRRPWRRVSCWLGRGGGGMTRRRADAGRQGGWSRRQEACYAGRKEIVRGLRAG